MKNNFYIGDNQEVVYIDDKEKTVIEMENQKIFNNGNFEEFNKIKFIFSRDLKGEKQ